MTWKLNPDVAPKQINHGPSRVISDGPAYDQYPQDARVAVGDLESDAKGSGARKNAGKPRLDLIPVSIWRAIWCGYDDTYSEDVAALLSALTKWQEGETHALFGWLQQSARPWMIAEGVKVLEFGIAKYKAWNWAKGMAWSVCVGCILRHCQKIIEDGQDIDDDSGHLHWGHIVANVIFLVYYRDHYPEGDDRPPQYSA